MFTQKKLFLWKVIFAGKGPIFDMSNDKSKEKYEDEDWTLHLFKMRRKVYDNFIIEKDKK